MKLLRRKSSGGEPKQSASSAPGAQNGPRSKSRTEAMAQANARRAAAAESAAAPAGGSPPTALAEAKAIVMPIVEARIDPFAARRLPRRDVAIAIKEIVIEARKTGRLPANGVDLRDLITAILNDILRGSPTAAARAAAEKANDDMPPHRPAYGESYREPPPFAESEPPEPPLQETAFAGDETSSAGDEGAESTYQPPQDDPFGLNKHEVIVRPNQSSTSSSLEEAKKLVQPLLLDRIDVTAAADLPRGELAAQITEIVSDIRDELKLRINMAEQRDLVTLLINDMLGLGPLEPLLADETINDIMVNGAHQIFVERKGKLALTDVHFRDDAHVMNIAQRIVSAIGRRIDESSPICDARLADGSRVNIIIPPLALDGPSISIRKFSKKSITLDVMARQRNISDAMSTVLKVASRSRLNILISGGTGSGKTTLLNAMSQLIDNGERIVTIEDAAELQLQQPHVVRLETRPANLEGDGEVTMRDLVKNALRMRPDRIILGEVRSSEAVDMLQAMNTGHDGSMCTIHANRPREALSRLENMIGMAGINLPSKAVRTQIAAAIDVIVQVSRMRDGMRRVTSITEIVGMEDDVITTQELFHFKFEGEDASGQLKGKFESSGLRPHFTSNAEYFGLDRTLLEAI